MFGHWKFSAVGAGILAIGLVSVCVGGPLPTSTEVLFEAPHLSKVDAGSTLSYHLEQTVSDPKVLGKPLEDDIEIDVARVADDGKRDVNVRVFKGEYARPEQSIAGLTGNPLLVVFLDRAVRNYSMVSGGKASYLKNRFKIELQKSSKVEPKKVPYNGSEVDGYEISVVPFVRDPARHKMKGYEGSEYKFLVSKDVPGYFVELVAVLESPKKGAPRLEERITFTGLGDKK